MVLPLWTRILARAGRVLQDAQRADAVLREELLLAYLPVRHREEFTRRAYSKLRCYLPGEDTFERGLAAWETELLSHPAVPRSGNVLLGGAGGGRELRALLDRGYSVFAFEPADGLVCGVEKVALDAPGTVCVRGSFSDLSRAVQGVGPLAGAPAPFDLVYFGWGSFTHVTEPEDQLEVLRAGLALAPNAPLVLSFWLRRPSLDSRTERFRKRVRKVLSLAGAGAPAPGVVVYDECGFGYCFERAEIESLASRAGYRVAFFSDTDFAHALLLPAVAPDVGSL